jgi:hypothetical protein
MALLEKVLATFSSGVIIYRDRSVTVNMLLLALPFIKKRRRGNAEFEK